MRIGEQWRSDLGTRLLASPRVTMVSTLLGIQKQTGYDRVRVGFTLEAPTEAPARDKTSLHVSGTQETDLLSGRLLLAEATIDNVGLDTPDGRIHGAIHLVEELLSPQPIEPTGGAQTP